MQVPLCNVSRLTGDPLQNTMFLLIYQTLLAIVSMSLQLGRHQLLDQLSLTQKHIQQKEELLMAQTIFTILEDH